MPARKLSLIVEHGASAISVIRPETDLVPDGSRSSVGHLRNHDLDGPEPLDSDPIVLVRCTKLKHLFISQFFAPARTISSTANPSL